MNGDLPLSPVLGAISALPRFGVVSILAAMDGEAAAPAMTQGERPIAVAIAIVTDGARVLIARRLANAALGGLWEFPGGKLEANETAAAAAVREVREELGLEVAPVETWPSIAHSYTHAEVVLTPVLCGRAGGEPVAIACASWQWVTAEELLGYQFPTANSQLTLQVARWLHLNGAVVESNGGCKAQTE